MHLPHFDSCRLYILSKLKSTSSMEPRKVLMIYIFVHCYWLQALDTFAMLDICPILYKTFGKKSVMAKLIEIFLWDGAKHAILEVWFYVWKHLPRNNAGFNHQCRSNRSVDKFASALAPFTYYFVTIFLSNVM